MVSRPLDVIGRAMCWICGGLLLLAFGSLLGFLAVRGAGQVDWSFLSTSPTLSGGNQGLISGGILDPIFGTIILTLMGTAIAFPFGVGAGVFLAEYRRPVWFARVTELAIEMIFSVPSIVIGICGLAIFTNAAFAMLSQTATAGGEKAFGRSFLVAAIALSLLAIPPIARSTQEALGQIPTWLREASYGLGKTKAATIRRLLLPAARPGVATGTILGMGRIAGDTAIVFLLLGATQTFGVGQFWWHPNNAINTLQGTGTTLTTYVYCASPAGECNAESRAYGAAFVLMFVILGLNALVMLISRRGVKWNKET